MSRNVRVSTGKDSPLVKELYTLFVNNEVPPDIKPADFRDSKSEHFGHIDTDCFRNAFNKAKKMARDATPPPDISKYPEHLKMWLMYEIQALKD